MKPVLLDVKKSVNTNYFRQMDYSLLFLVLALSAIGLLVLYSALQSFDDGTTSFMKQLVFMIFGFVIAILLARFDYSDYKVLGFLLYVASTFLLVLVKLKPATLNGASSWLDLPGIGRFQPSEIAKITFIMVVAVFLARIKDGEGKFLPNLLKLVIYSAIPILFIIDQPDYGTAMVFVFMLVLMLYIFGIKLRYYLFAIIAAVPIIAGIWFFLLNPLRRSRILTFFNPSSVTEDSSYQILRAKTAIGSGGLTGKGLFNGPQNLKGIVPIKESDFIFTVSAEELGFIGSTIIIILFICLLIRCIYVAKNARDTYGTLLVTGITGLLGFHFIENIGMNIDLLPITGIPFPFFSLGNSSMLTVFIAVGIVLSVSIRRRSSRNNYESTR
ncbi:MAG: FtsW/RodA/SpoVE family cell cycle protein [Bacillota bacterium]